MISRDNEPHEPAPAFRLSPQQLELFEKAKAENLRYVAVQDGAGNDMTLYWSPWDEIVMWGILMIGLPNLIGGLALPFVGGSGPGGFERLQDWLFSTIYVALGLLCLVTFSQCVQRRRRAKASLAESGPHSATVHGRPRGGVDL